MYLGLYLGLDPGPGRRRYLGKTPACWKILQGSFSAGWLAGKPAASKPTFTSKYSFVHIVTNFFRIRFRIILQNISALRALGAMLRYFNERFVHIWGGGFYIVVLIHIYTRMPLLHPRLLPVGGIQH